MTVKREYDMLGGGLIVGASLFTLIYFNQRGILPMPTLPQAAAILPVIMLGAGLFLLVENK